MSATGDANPFILPLGTSIVPGGIYSTYGAALIGVIVSGYLLGILTVQAYMYYNSGYKDSMLIKGMVALILAFDIAHFVNCVQFVWWYLIQNYGNLAAIQLSRPPVTVFLILGVVVVGLVQVVFLQRVWILSKKNILVTGVTGVLILAQFALGLATLIPVQKVLLWASGLSTERLHILVTSWLATGLASDLSLAMCLCYYLLRNRSGFESTDNVVMKLVYFSMNTCLLTFFLAVIDLVFFLTMPTNFIHIAFNLLLCKVYSNSLMASLNARRTLQKELSNSYTLSDTGASGPMQFGVAVQSQMDVFPDDEGYTRKRGHLA